MYFEHGHQFSGTEWFFGSVEYPVYNVEKKNKYMEIVEMFLRGL